MKYMRYQDENKLIWESLTNKVDNSTSPDRVHENYLYDCIALICLKAKDPAVEIAYEFLNEKDWKTVKMCMDDLRYKQIQKEKNQ